MAKKKDEITIRSSAAEYLTYVASVGDQQDSIEMRYENENIWLTQKMMATLYDVGLPTINEHIKKIYADSELEEAATIRNFRIVQTEGSRQVTRNTKHYNLQMIIAVKNLGGGGYFKELLERIRDIRASEKVFYRQVLEIYATSIDYDPKAEISIAFFKKVQNKIHYAIHGQTAAEVIYTRADTEKEFMGLTTFKGNQPTLNGMC